MPNLLLDTFTDPEHVVRTLEHAMQPYGQFGVRARKSISYGMEGFTEAPDEFEVWIQNQAARGKAAQDVWHGVVKGGPNQTLQIRSGEGYEFMIGDLLPVGERGIGGTKGQEAFEAMPFYTGVESFGRRVAAAFGMASVMKRDPNKPEPGIVNRLFRDINQLATPGGALYKAPGGGEIGRIPQSTIRTGPQESPGQLRYLSSLYNVPIIGDVAKSVKALHQQVSQYVPTPGGTPAGAAWSRLFGGGVFEPGQKSGGLFVPPAAFGTPYVTEEGITQVSALTERGLKRSYEAGRREVAEMVVHTGSRAVPLPEEFQREAAITMRPGEATFKGIPVQALTAMGKLPWQSGQMQFRLPEEIRQYVMGLSEPTSYGETPGAQLGAAYKSRQKFTISGLENIGALIEGGLELDKELIGKILEPGRAVQFGKWGKMPEGVEGIERLEMTPGQQQTAITGYRLNLPYTLGDTPEKLAMLEPQFQQLRERGVTKIDWTAPVGAPYLDVLTSNITTAGLKGGGAKGQINVPLFRGAEGRGLELIPQVLERTQGGQGALPYNVLQEAKNVDVVMFNALQAMGKEDPTKIYEFMRYLFPEKGKAITSYQTAQAGARPSLEAMGQAIGEFQTGEQLVYEVTNRALQYKEQVTPTGREVVQRPFSEINLPFNEEMLKRFGVGRVAGTVPIEQFAGSSREMVQQQIVKALMQGEGGLSQEQAEQTMRERFKLQLDKKLGIYTPYYETEFLAAPKLQTFVTETSGLGSTQGEMQRAMQAQGFSELAGYMEKNYAQLFRDSPARQALRQTTAGWLQTRAQAPALAESSVVGQGGIDPETLRLAAQRGGEGLGSIGRVEAYSAAYRELAGTPEGKAEQLMYLPGQGVSLMSPQSALALESNRLALAEEGQLEFESQGQVTTKYARILEGLLTAEAGGFRDPGRVEEATAFMGQYVSSEQLRKSYGGLFSRYGGSALTEPGIADVSQQWLRRQYLAGGGSQGSMREYQQYLRTMQGATAIGIRQPAPVIGGEDYPGAIQPMILRTPASKMGGRIWEAARQGAMMLPELILPQLQRQTLGDLDLDPYTLLPMAFRIPRTRGKGFKWERFEPGEGSYKEWMGRVMQYASPEMQERTFERVFGPLAGQMDPWSEQMRSAMGTMFPGQGEGLLSNRLALQMQGTQRQVETWNEQKGIRMGAVYNAFLRRTESAGTVLGMPERELVRARDISGGQYYQKAVDMEAIATAWESLMSSAGFYPRGEDARQGVTFGARMSSGERTTWAMNMWDPTRAEAGELARPLGLYLATTPGARPEAVASMLTNIPERGEMGQEEFGQMVSERMSAVQAALEPAMAAREGEQPVSRDVRVLNALTELSGQGLIGERSIAVQSALARGVEYVSKDPARRRVIEAATTGAEGQGLMRVGGQKLTFGQLAEQTRPISDIYDFLRHKPEAQGYKSTERLESLLRFAQERGVGGSVAMQQIWRSFGSLAGLPSPAGQVPVEAPMKATGIAEIDEAIAEYMQTITPSAGPQYERSRQMLRDISMGQGGRVLRASSLAYPGGYTGPEIYGRRGTQAHAYLAEYLKSGEVPGVTGVEQRLMDITSTVSGHTDFLQDIPAGMGEGREIVDLKTGTTDPGAYAGQMAAYKYLTGAQQARIMQVPRAQVRQFRMEELARVQAGEVTYPQARMNIGRRIYQAGMETSTVLGAEEIGPQALESALQGYAAAQGIPITPPLTGEEAQAPAAAPAGGAGGGGQPPRRTTVAAAEPEPEPQEPRRPRGEAERISSQDFLRGAQAMGTEIGTNIFAQLAPLITKAGTMRTTTRKLSPERFGAFYGAAAQMTGRIGTFAEGGEFTPGPIMEEFQQLPQLLASYFPEEGASQILAAGGPSEAVGLAAQLAPQFGVNIGNITRRNPQVRRLLESYKTMDYLGKTVAKNYGAITTGMLSATGGAGPATILRALGEDPEATQVLPQIAGMMGGLEALQGISSKTPATPAKMEPLTAGQRDIVSNIVEDYKSVTTALEAHRDSLKNYKGTIIDVDDALQQLGETDAERAFTLGRQLREAGIKRGVLAQELGVQFQLGDVGGVLTPEQMRVAGGRAAVKGELSSLQQYSTARQRELEMEADIFGRVQEGGGEGGGGLGSRIGMLGRRLLGGFGLMYMRSVAGIMLSGTQLGYQEQMAEQAQAQGVMGAQFGGMVPTLTPEAQYSRAAAMYGGTGWSGLRMLQARALREQPGLTGIGGIATAGVGAYAAASWMGMLAGPGSILAGAAPWAAGAAALGVGALNIYGAATQVEPNAVAMAARTARGDFQDMSLLEQATTAFDFQRMGWGLNRGQQDPIIQQLLRMNQAQQGGQDPRTVLTAQGMAPAEVNRYMSMFVQMQGERFPEISVEALAQTQALQTQYGLPLTDDTRRLLGAGLMQGVPYQQTAMAAAYTPFATLAQQRERAGGLIGRWLTPEIGGLQAQQAETLITGAERYRGLGPFVETPEEQGITTPSPIPGGGMVTIMPGQLGVPPAAREQLIERLGLMGEAQYGALRGAYDIATQQAMMFGTQVQRPDIARYEDITGPEELARVMREQGIVQARQGAQQQLQAARFGLGMEGVLPAELINAPVMAINQARVQAQTGLGVAQQLMAGGMDLTRAQTVGQAFTQMDPRQAAMYGGVMNLDPMRMAQWAMQLPGGPQSAMYQQLFGGAIQAGRTLPGIGGQQVGISNLFMTDVNQQGQLTGLPWGTTSLAMPGVTGQEMAGRIWGGNFAGRTDINQGMVQALIGGGQRGGQLYQMQLGAQYQAAQSGIALQQIALQREYQPQFWAIQDQMRNLGYQQQEFGFGMQERQMEMQNRFFQESFGQNVQGAMMQRQWARADWGLQDQTRAMQWQWRQEDFQEQARFMTGRERRLAERGMERETIMYGIEGERIDTQRQRQEEMWGLEDERFDTQRRQQMESLALQEEQLQKTREFFEERKVLEERQVVLQREYWEKNIALQEQAAAASAGYAAKQNEIALTMMELQNFVEDARGQINLLNEESLTELVAILEEIDPTFAAFIEKLINAEKAMRGAPIPSGGGGGGRPGEATPMAGGGRVYPGRTYEVNEAGQEFFQPDMSGSIIPLSKLDPFRVTMIGDSPGGESGGTQTIHLQVFLGDEMILSKFLNAIDQEIR